MKRIDLTGKRFGKLTVVEYDYNQRKYKCVCDCGNIIYVLPQNLRGNQTRSCGCLVKSRHNYGWGKQPLYHVWYTMKSRTDIGVCDEWLDFSNFKDWMLSKGYENGMRIHRINLSQKFSPDNVKVYKP